jgi:DNA-binding transcriptional LysR family regulator
VFGVRYLATAAAAFGALYPRIRVDLSLNDRVVDLVEEGYDVAVRIGELAESSLIARRLAPCHILLCASPGYLARAGTPQRPEDLLDHNCLMYSYARSGSTWRMRRGAETVEVKPQGNLVANNGDALLAASLADAGIVRHPSFIAADALRDGRLVRVLPDWSADRLAVFAMYPSIRNLSPKVRGFVDFLAGRFGDRPPWDAGLGL